MLIVKYKLFFTSYSQLTAHNRSTLFFCLDLCWSLGLHTGKTTLCFFANMIFTMTWQSYQNTEVTLIDHSAEIFKTLNYLGNLLHTIKHPLGTRDNPAQICKDLLNCEHTVSDGKLLVSLNCDILFHHFSVFEILSVLMPNLMIFDKTLAEVF